MKSSISLFLLSLLFAFIAFIISLQREKAKRTVANGNGISTSTSFGLYPLVLIVAISVISSSIIFPVFNRSGTPATPWFEMEGWKGLIQFSCMVLGMFSKGLWDAIEARQPKQPIEIDYWSFVKPALVSPIVFIVVMQSTGQKLSLLMLCFAFQNGFFWQTILGKSQTQLGEKPTPTPAFSPPNRDTKDVSIN